MPRPSATTGLGKTTFVSVALLACFLSCAHLVILSTTRRMDGSTRPPSDFLSRDDASGGIRPVESPSSSSSRKKDRDVRRVASSTTTTTSRPPPPTNIYLLGERNSGTNYAAGILRDAFDPPNAVDGSSRVHEYFSSNVPVLRHKHMFRHSLLSEIELREIRRRTDALWILVVRRPCDWAEAMKRAPWHMCMPRDISSECPGAELVGFEHFEQLRNYTLAEFFGVEWGDWPESTNFRNLSFVSEEFTYRNIFHLRRHKLKLMKQIVDAVPRNVKIVRLHELELSPEMFIKASMSACNIVQEFNVTLKKNYHLRRPSNMLHAERCLTGDEWRIAQHEIDWNVEGYFGYTRLDCHRCYGGPTAVSNILPRYVSIEQGWRAIGQGGMRISPNRKGGAASTNEPKVQGRTKQSTAEKTDKSMKQATIRRSSAMADSNRGSSVTQKVKENFQLKKKDLVH